MVINQTNKRGFTLVELSIVLVIIGLLISGILVGQSLIDSAKINQAVRQIQQYDIAVSQFQNKFRQLPGDSLLMTPEGNNDGDPNDITGETSCGLATCYEYMSFWKHLSDSNMLKKEYTNDFSSAANNGWQENVNSPSFLETRLTVQYFGSDNTVYYPKGWTYGDALNSGDMAVSTNEFFALENKLDDNNAATGDIRGFSRDTLSGCTISDDDCSITIRILSTAGNPIE